MRMPKSLSAGIGALAVAIAMPACAQPAPAAIQDADPALWVVKDEDTTIYLFGTVHVLKPGLSWFDEAVKKAFDSSNEVVLELVQPPEATMQQTIIAKAMAPAGTPALTERLPEAKRATYAKAMTDLGLPAAAFDRFDPWFAGMTLAILPLQKAGYDPKSGAETVITEAAKAANKPVGALETFEQQIGFFDTLSDTAQMAFLTATVDELPKVNETMATMVSHWSKGDPAALGELMNESMQASPEVAKVLLYDRNAAWAKWIDERMDKPGTVFIAVGAGHLAGQQSVQDYLKTYKLEAIRVDY